MDGMKRLAEKLVKQKAEVKPQKAPHTLSLNHEAYVTLLAYCKRKGLGLGDVVSEMMQILIEELATNGDLTEVDHSRAEEFERAREERDARKQVKKVG